MDHLRTDYVTGNVRDTVRPDFASAQRSIAFKPIRHLQPVPLRYETIEEAVVSTPFR